MRLPSQIRDAMVNHARFTYPEEACGLLASERGRLRMAYCLTNRDRSPYRYTLDPDEHYHALRHAERHGWQLAGVFHSHVTSAPVPSGTDIERALDPEWLYVIVSLRRVDAPEISAYRIRDGTVTQELLVVE